MECKRSKESLTKIRTFYKKFSNVFMDRFCSVTDGLDLLDVAEEEDGKRMCVI